MTDSSKSGEGISPTVSARICKHMNEDHAATIHAMVLSSLESRGDKNVMSKIKDAQMTSVTLSCYHLKYLVCDKKVCSMQKLSVNFVPPMQSPDEARMRLIEEHHRVLSPQLLWLATDIMARVIVVLCTVLGYCNYFVFRQTEPAVSYSFLAAIGIHFLEALFVVYLCRTNLKLKLGATLKWFVLVCCAGYPMTSRVTALVKVDYESKMNKKAS
mmetsp:Transcript_16874/g.24722  ORF Transcript_16874/g.24722 Transcript_16874/m.24722 type:complete len:214 (-) Transcript_16874:154-795(-)|eukprot:CAMPEP_0195530370 /NCGR_PEP_ID=MMETSP0794_2-20130614/33222_1 /TAXON_ID=515487 /ORGANISM="Stephanopyxis turris, Strain CCMP 815" /LENGTH=213 /DNA_ID=CAMNT_0040661861 /DNA_START=155 /DNA_END=796 /DNA_ORIENTATION=+